MQRRKREKIVVADDTFVVKIDTNNVDHVGIGAKIYVDVADFEIGGSGG